MGVFSAQSNPFPDWTKRAIEIVVVGALYYAAARLGLLLAFEKTNASPIWPASGIALAAMLLRGYRVWPGILLGAFLANVVLFLHNQVASPWIIFAVSLLLSVGNTIEALVGCLLLRRLSSRPDILDRAQNVCKFVAVALLMCLTSASIGPTSLCAAGIISWSLHAKVWFTWWLGDAVGVIVVTPLVLAWSRLQRPAWDLRCIAEAVATMATVCAISWISFWGWPFSQETNYPLVFLTIPLLLWPTFRLGQRGAVTALFLVSGIAVWKTIHGDGPFVQKTLPESLLLMGGFIGVVTTTVLSIAAILSERHEAEEGLLKAQEKLAAQVQEQTADLRHTTESLLVEIAERKQAEEALREKSEELARSNQELTQFASVASHDLQEPLRKVIAFSNLLRTHLGGSLDPEAQDYMQRMHGSVERMEKLIADLLTLARVTTKAKPLEKIELAGSAQEALSDLETMISQSGGRVEVGSLPQVNADPLQMRQLLQNLIANAIKFHKINEPPRVRISGKNLNNGFCEIAVEDNGIGFEEKYLDRIFKPFQRLHSRVEYEGTGIGLAICDKIVMRHGGTISAKSSLGKGALFTVMLPTPYRDSLMPVTLPSASHEFNGGVV